MIQARTALALAAILGVLALAPPVQAVPIGYWRMEVDDDPDPQGLSTPNQFGFGTPLESTEAVLDAANLPVASVPLTSDANHFSLGAALQGGPNGINAAADWYPELAVTSITVELWARTQENTATPFRFTSGGLDGIVLSDPNGLDVTWHVDVAGTPTAFSMTNLDDMDAAWSHYAFAYDEVSGDAFFYVDGLEVRRFDGPAGSPLILVPGTPVQVGVQMDFADASMGTIDELRIHGSVLPSEGFLQSVPEPGTGLLVASGLLGLAGARRSRGCAGLARRDKATESQRFSARVDFALPNPSHL